MNKKLQENISILENFLEFELVEDKGEKAVIKFLDYNLTYPLKADDEAFIIAVMIIYDFEINNLKESYEREVPLFSGSDILDLKAAIQADEEHLGSIWGKYFYDDKKALKSQDKQYLLDYITFINRAFFS